MHVCMCICAFVRRFLVKGFVLCTCADADACTYMDMGACICMHATTGMTRVCVHVCIYMGKRSYVRVIQTAIPEEASYTLTYTHIQTYSQIHTYALIGTWMNVLTFQAWFCILTNTIIFGFSSDQMCVWFPWMFTKVDEEPAGELVYEVRASECL